jgi:hypothetical protein
MSAWASLLLAVLLSLAPAAASAQLSSEEAAAEDAADEAVADPTPTAEPEAPRLAVTVASDVVGSGWPSATGQPTRYFNPRIARRTDEELFVAGMVTLAAGYAGSVAFGVALLENDDYRPSGCLDQYRAFHFVPVLGSLMSLISAFACDFDEIGGSGGAWPFLDGLLMVPQLTGLVLSTIALFVGEGYVEVEVMPGATGARATIRF